MGCEKPSARFTTLPWTAALKPTPWISSFLTKPSVTPWTMLLTSARLKPCSALACASSPSRLTMILPSATFRLVRFGNSQSSLPFGPSTRTFCPLTSTFTFGGMAIGCFPIRDINLSLPDVADDLAAEVLFARLHPGHQAFRRRNHRHAHSIEHARNLRRADIAAQARRADAAQALDHAL